MDSEPRIALVMYLRSHKARSQISWSNKRARTTRSRKREPGVGKRLRTWNPVNRPCSRTIVGEISPRCAKFVT